MRFLATADTDIGLVKTTNQDSLLIKHAKSPLGEIVMAIVCDGMGGLDKGEIASAVVIRRFDRWFNEELPVELEHLDLKVIGGKWSLLLKELNSKISEYASRTNSTMGTTFTGILLIDGKYVAAHVGDSRLYHLGSYLKQLTTDHTFIAREIARGTMTREQAMRDKRRNMLLQCVGASKTVEPEILYGDTERGVYMICSDGFRHEITEDEIFESLKPINLMNKAAMHNNSRYLIDQVKKRGEKDNISVLLIKVD